MDGADWRGSERHVEGKGTAAKVDGRQSVASGDVSANLYITSCGEQ